MTIFELLDSALSGLVGVDWQSLLLPAIIFLLVLIFVKR